MHLVDLHLSHCAVTVKSQDQTLSVMQDHFYHLQPNCGILFLPKFQPLDQGPVSAGRLIAFCLLLHQLLLNYFLSLLLSQLCQVIKNVMFELIKHIKEMNAHMDRKYICNNICIKNTLEIMHKMLEIAVTKDNKLDTIS